MSRGTGYDAVKSHQRQALRRDDHLVLMAEGSAFTSPRQRVACPFPQLELMV